MFHLSPSMSLLWYGSSSMRFKEYLFVELECVNVSYGSP